MVTVTYTGSNYVAVFDFLPAGECPCWDDIRRLPLMWVTYLQRMKLVIYSHFCV